MADKFAIKKLTGWKKGDVLVYVDDEYDESTDQYFQEKPELYESYIIRDIFLHRIDELVLLEGIDNKKIRLKSTIYTDVFFEFEPAFSVHHFIKLEEDIELDEVDFELF